MFQRANKGRAPLEIISTTLTPKQPSLPIFRCVLPEPGLVGTYPRANCKRFKRLRLGKISSTLIIYFYKYYFLKYAYCYIDHGLGLLVGAPCLLQFARPFGRERNSRNQELTETRC